MKISSKFLELTNDWLYQSQWNINSYKVPNKGWYLSSADINTFLRMIGAA